MIRHILLPEAYNGYYIFNTQILGMHVTEHAIYATMLIASGWDRTITRHLYEPLHADTELTFAERAQDAIARIREQAGHYDRLHIALPSREAIYKEVSLPFSDRHKIANVAPFEIEDSLPFGLDEAVVTTLPVRYEAEQTQVLTITYRQSTLEQYLDAFAQHNMHPDLTTCDAVAYYNAFYNVPAFLQAEHVICYVDIDTHTSRVFVIDHGALRLVRTVNHGISNVCQISDTNYEALLKSIKSCNLEETTWQNSSLNRDVQFTIAAADKMLDPDKDISQICITGIGAEVSGITSALSQTTPVKPETMHVNLPLRMPNVTTQRNSHVPPIFMTSLAAAMPVPEQSEFHIRRDTVTPRERELRTQQLLAATALTLFFFIGFFAYSMYTAYTFRSEVQQRQQKLQNQIKNTFGISTKSKTKIPDLIGQAKKKVSQEESLWFSLSQQRRNSFLYYLQELSTYVDRKDLGLTLRKLVIQRDSKQGTETMKLEGRVKDYPALKKFETALRESKLFTQIPPLQDVTFDITLTIQPSKE